MKFIKNTKSFFAGAIVMLLCVLMVNTVLGASASRTLTAIFRDISITIDGEVIEPQDAYGNVVEPFIVDGTTYLPVRAIAEAVGYDVAWDGDTNTVILTSRESGMVGTFGNESQLPDDTHALVGTTWNWEGMTFYVFSSNGHGTMGGQNIHWWTNNGILSICTTPESCGNTCILPSEWYYIIEGDQLTLTSRLMPDLSFIYTKE